MDTFFDDEEYRKEDREQHELSGDSFDWSVKTVGQGGAASSVTFRIDRCVDEKVKTKKWKIDRGIVDATLSLWAAAVESELESKMREPENLKREKVSRRSSPVQQFDWRRKKDSEENANRKPFRRILGCDDKDGALRRDLTWWADYEILYGSMTEAAEEDAERDTDSGDDVVVIGFDHDWLNGKSSPCETTHHCAKEFPCLGDDIQQCHQSGSEVTTSDLFSAGENSLLNIFAQHLFCSFVWQVSTRLSRTCLKLSFKESSQEVEIDGRDRFDPNRLKDTWMSPRLSHKKLTGLVRHMENYGLGSRQEILLCLVPAFSCQDLLPSHAMLRLMPSPVPKDDGWTDDGWAETAQQYSELLETGLRKEENKAEILCCAAVIYTLDFLYIAYQPYDKFVRPQSFLNWRFGELVLKLSSNDFAHVVRDLEPVHNRQSRRAAFRSLFTQYATQESSDLYKSGNSDIHEHYPDRVFGFSKPHEIGGGPNHQLIQTLIRHGDIDAQDIFGWTPFHYVITASSFSPREIRNSVMHKPHVYQTPDRLGRTPVHVAAAFGDADRLKTIFFAFGRREIRAGIQARGIDGMTPLHLAAMDSDSLKIIMEEAMRSSVRTNLQDIWRREPMHVAARHWQGGGINHIMQIGAGGDWFLPADSLGRTPIHYLLTTAISDEKAEIDEAGRLDMLARICRDKPDWQDQEGKGFLHLAVHANDKMMVEKVIGGGININHSDDRGRTAIALAYTYGYHDIFKILADDEGTDLNQTAYMAATEGLEELLAVLLEYAPSRVKITAVDSSDDTALAGALKARRYSCAEMLLRYSLVLDPGQRQNLKQELTSFNQLEVGINKETVEELIDEDDDSQLGRLIEFSGQLKSRGLFEKLMAKAVEETTWKQLKRPYHLAIQIGGHDMIQTLRHEGVDPGDIDEDGWTWEYSALRYGQASLLESLPVDSLRTKAPMAFYPDGLLWDSVENFIHIRPCEEARHNLCHGIHGILFSSHHVIRSLLIHYKAYLSTRPPTTRSVFVSKVDTLHSQYRCSITSTLRWK